MQDTATAAEQRTADAPVSVLRACVLEQLAHVADQPPREAEAEARQDHLFEVAAGGSVWGFEEGLAGVCARGLGGELAGCGGLHATHHSLAARPAVSSASAATQRAYAPLPSCRYVASAVPRTIRGRAPRPPAPRNAKSATGAVFRRMRSSLSLGGGELP